RTTNQPGEDELGHTPATALSCDAPTDLLTIFHLTTPATVRPRARREVPRLPGPRVACVCAGVRRDRTTPALPSPEACPHCGGMLGVVPMRPLAAARRQSALRIPSARTTGRPRTYRRFLRPTC